MDAMLCFAHQWGQINGFSVISSSLAHDDERANSAMIISLFSVGYTLVANCYLKLKVIILGQPDCVSTFQG